MNPLRFDLHNKDYAFELSATNLIIREKAKNRAESNKACSTALRLRDHLVQITEQNRVLHARTRDELRQFLQALRERTENRLSEQHCYLAPLLRILQYIFSFGASAAIADAEKALDTARVSDAGAVTLDRVDEAAVERQQFQQEHAKLIELFQLENCSNREELSERLQGALIHPTTHKLLYKHKLSFQSIAILLPLLAKIEQLKPVHRRFLQLQSALLETQPIARFELMRLAFFIEWTIQQDDFKDTLFHTSKTGLSHNIQTQKDTRDFFVIANPGASVLQEPGKDSKFKEVMAAARCNADDFALAPEITACLFTKLIDLDEEGLNAKALDEKTLRQDVKNTRQEIAFCKEFSGKRGIVEFRAAAQFTVDKKPRISMIFTRCTGNLAKRVFGNQRPISLEEMILVAKDLAAGLHTMHTAKVFHLDIKLHNTLFNEDEAGKITRAALCDFGCACRDHEDRMKLMTPACFRSGHSSTVAFTPPELYGVRNFAGSLYAVDVWSLGCVLYQLFYRKKLSWEQDIKEHIKRNFDDVTGLYKNNALLGRTRQKFAEKVQEAIEVRFAALQASDRASPAEKFEFLILQMMRFDPDQRIQIDLFRQKIDQL